MSCLGKRGNSQVHRGWLAEKARPTAGVSPSYLSTGENTSLFIMNHFPHSWGSLETQPPSQHPINHTSSQKAEGPPQSPHPLSAPACLHQPEPPAAPTVPAAQDTQPEPVLQCLFPPSRAFTVLHRISSPCLTPVSRSPRLWDSRGFSPSTHENP